MISPGEEDQYPFSLAIAPSGDLHVLWHTFSEGARLLLASSKDGGQTWNTSEQIGSDVFPLWSKLVIDQSGNLYVMGLNANNKSIYFNRSLDDGVTWPAARDVYTFKEDMGFATDGGWDIVEANSNLYAVWDESPAPSKGHIHFVSSQALTAKELAKLPSPTPTSSPTPKPIAAAPKPAAPANCPNPGVQITSPAEGSVFHERYVFIIGTANISRFHHWRMEYSTVNDGHTWNHLLERDYPVDNDKLMRLDTSTVPRGPYGLRLTVVDETGNYPEPCEVWFTNGY
jgi:hypothetical protein